MIIGIIVAMGKELELLLPLLENLQKPTEINGFKFHTGTLGKHGIIAMQCGIGKVNAAVGTLTMLDGFHPEYIINTGVAGGTGHTHVLDLLVADGVAYHDVWCGPGTEYGTASGFDTILKPWDRVVELAHELMPAGKKTKFGLICSGDKFISRADEVREITSHFPDVMAVDMESAAIAQVCVLRGVPFNILRVISDTPGEQENISQYENFWSDAPQETFGALTALLKHI